MSKTAKSNTTRKAGGAPRGNLNAGRHFMYGSKLPKGLAYVERRTNALRRQLEAAILQMRGKINIPDAATVNSILRWERHALLAEAYMRREKKLSPAEVLKYSEIIAKASDARDRNIHALGLDEEITQTMWAVVDQPTKRLTDQTALEE